MPAWPGGLPCRPVRGLTIQFAPNKVGTPNDVGPPIQRRRFTGQTVITSGSLLLTKAQKVTLYDFWANTLAQGTLEFAMESWHDRSIQDHSFPLDFALSFREMGTRWECPMVLHYTVT